MTAKPTPSRPDRAVPATRDPAPNRDSENQRSEIRDYKSPLPPNVRLITVTIPVLVGPLPPGYHGGPHWEAQLKPAEAETLERVRLGAIAAIKASGSVVQPGEVKRGHVIASIARALHEALPKSA